MRYLSPAEITCLAEAMPERYRALVVFDAFCGLRLSEIVGLRRLASISQPGRCGAGHTLADDMTIVPRPARRWAICPMAMISSSPRRVTLRSRNERAA